MIKFFTTYANFFLYAIAGFFFARWTRTLLVDGDFELTSMMYFICALMLAYRFSDKFERRNNLDELIKRKEDSLVIRSVHPFPIITLHQAKSIEIERISKVAISDNWLSIIIDGNGNGFDFQLADSKENIESHLKNLMVDHNTSQVDFQFV